jgi:hypothetical protein
MSLYSVNVTADQLVINSGSKAAVDALQKAYQMGGQVEIRVDSGGGTKRYFGLIRLSNGVAETVEDGDYILRSDDDLYYQVVRETEFEADYTLVDESS